MKLYNQKNKKGIIALTVIALLILFVIILPSASSTFSFFRDLIVILSISGVLLLLWKILAQLENLGQGINDIHKKLSEDSSIRQPVCKKCGKLLLGGVNYCPECGADQR